MNILQDIELTIASVIVGAFAGFIVTVNKLKKKLKLFETVVSVLTSSFLGFMAALALEGVAEPKIQLFTAAIAGAGGYPLLLFLVGALKMAIVQKIQESTNPDQEVKLKPLDTGIEDTFTD